jgi:Ca2+-transporting ATPase
MLFGPAIGLTLPLLPAQILWINLLTHGLTGVGFGSEPADPADMSRPPRPPSESIFTRRSRVALIVATTPLTVTALLVGAVVSGSTDERRTSIFVVLGLGQLGVALALRARGVSRRLNERGLELALATAAVLQLSATFVPALRSLLGTTSLPLTTLMLLTLVAAVPGILVGTIGTRIKAGVEKPTAVRGQPDASEDAQGEQGADAEGDQDDRRCVEG